MWSNLLKFLGFRQQARMTGMDAKDANKAAGIGVVLTELEKKAAEEEKAAKKKKQ